MHAAVLKCINNGSSHVAVQLSKSISRIKLRVDLVKSDIIMVTYSSRKLIHTHTHTYIYMFLPIHLDEMNMTQDQSLSRA